MAGAARILPTSEIDRIDRLIGLFRIQSARLPQCGSDLMRSPDAVEEVLRHHSSVLLVTEPGNHDDAVFPDGDSLDIRRPNANRHVAFGFGNHTCMGSTLARLEMRIILEELARRLPHLRLVGSQRFGYSPNTSFRGPEHVLVEWDPGRNPVSADRP